jgi:hypothetical protein
MNAEARTLVEPAEGSTGARHVVRRILIATVLGFALLVVLAGRSRADVLDPAQAAAESAPDAVGQATETTSDTVSETVSTVVDTASETASTVVDTASETASTVVDTATETVQPIVQGTTDTVDPVIGAVSGGLRPVRKAAETVLPGTKGVVPQDPSNPEPPIPGVMPLNPGTSPALHADVPRPSTEWSARTDIAPAAASWSPSSMASSGSNTDGAPASGGSGRHGGGATPFGPLGRAAADGPLMLLVLSAAMTASILVRPPPIRSLLAPSVVAPNGAALALSVERPG